MTDPNPVLTPPETVTIDNLDHFARLMAQWHASTVAQAQHLLEVPEGSTFSIDDVPLTLQGDTLRGFKLGVEMALMRFKELPFAFETEDEAPAETEVTQTGG